MVKKEDGFVPMSVLQPWVQELTLMQQGVLMASIRGPDGIEKNHISKLLIRWLRRCVLVMAFESRAVGSQVFFWDPCTPGGGSFTGPSLTVPASFNIEQWNAMSFSERFLHWPLKMNVVVQDFFKHVDEMPHHFHLHFLHAAEILGYKHPHFDIRKWWRWFYFRLVNDLHLNPESEERMDLRLGDTLEKWLAAEEVTADGPKEKF
jgi:hypothetical protein